MTKSEIKFLAQLRKTIENEDYDKFLEKNDYNDEWEIIEDLLDIIDNYLKKEYGRSIFI